MLLHFSVEIFSSTNFLAYKNLFDMVVIQQWRVLIESVSARTAQL